MFPVLRRILEIGDGAIEIEWKEIGRELNVVVDTLAKQSHRIRDTNVIFDDIPDFLVHVISLDSCGSVGPLMRS